MKTSRGSISVYLCLTLTLVIALFAAMLQSVRTACGRTMVSSATEQGISSLFAQYDRQLLEEYDLFYIDGGYGSGSLQMGRLYDTIYDAATRSLSPYGQSFAKGNMCGVSFADGSITGYTLATDQTGNSFASQVSEYMKLRLGVLGIQQISQIMNSQNQSLTNQEQGILQIPDSNPLDTYEQQLANGSSEEHDASNIEETEGTEITEVEVPDKNPIDVIREIRKMGILEIVAEHPEELSGACLEEELPSGRKLQQGMGVQTGDKADIGDKLLMQEYLIDKFPNYCAKKETGGLRYQLEYAIAGKDSDQENLKSVVNQIMVMREGANMLYLYSSLEKKAQADALAAAIAAAFGIPVAQSVIALALIACWAFAESILDVRELLAGGKIALIKSDASWQLSISNIGKLLEGKDQYRRNIEDGVDYRGYLRMLLTVKSHDTLTKKAMDLVEYNMNLKNPEKEFRIDCCVGALETEGKWNVARQIFTVRKSYSYIKQ
ncbi:MAG: DUF5702 domain-containing protein [Lachnospiraceae bacterium]|nr:DUF5702 domain-containing protein [Lachnospiraceae bacterium]